MVQIKPADADRFLAKADPAIRVVLIYGSDEGLIAERAERFGRAVVGDGNDPLAHVRFDGATLADDPAALADEAHAVPLFGGQRIISVRAVGNRSIEPAIGMILKAPPVDAWIVVTAGELRKSAPLRKVCESHPRAAAIASYADGGRDLDRIIDEETTAAALAIDADARSALKELIGSDRLVSRSEVRKLCLYAADKDGITLADVRAVIGDSGAFAVDETLDAMALGDGAGLDRGYRRLLAAGTPGFVVASAALRHFNFLQTARADYDGGAAADGIVARAIPPIFFSRRADVARQIEGWSAARTERALALLDAAMLDSRLHGPIADEVIGQALQLAATLAANARRS